MNQDMSPNINPDTPSNLKPETKAEPILKMDEVSKSFGGVKALENVSVEVYPGDILGIIGPNGSGKTTIVNSITGFIKPTSGRVYFKKKNITGMEPHKIADMGVTRTFQVMRPYYSLPAYKNLIIPLFSPRAKRTGGWRGGGRLGWCAGHNFCPLCRGRRIRPGEFAKTPQGASECFG